MAAPEDDANLDFVAIFDELPGMAGLGFKVVLSDLRGDLNLFKLSRVLIFAGQSVLLLLLKAEFSVVEDFADRRIGVGGDAIEVKVVTHG